jgi:hypothetical protein
MNLFTRNSPYCHLLKYLLFLLKHPVYWVVFLVSTLRRTLTCFIYKQISCMAADDDCICCAMQHAVSAVLYNMLYLLYYKACSISVLYSMLYLPCYKACCIYRAIQHAVSTVLYSVLYLTCYTAYSIFRAIQHAVSTVLYGMLYLPCYTACCIYCAIQHAVIFYAA